MLVVRYQKLGGAEFISHLDTLRHLQKTIIRAKIPVEYSKGFNPHMLIFMSAPIGVGLKSEAEFFFLETSVSPAEMTQKFNLFCPRGFRALDSLEVRKNPNLQALIDSAEYFIESNVSQSAIDEILFSKEFIVVDKRGQTRDMRDRIISLKKCDNGLIARLSFGNETLRADVFADALAKKYNATVGDISKTECFIKGESALKYIKDNF